jgi:hypothetical protein
MVLRKKRSFMTRHLTPFTAFLILSLAISDMAIGQSRWGIDFRPSLNFPTRLFSGVRLEPGFGFDANVTYNFIGNAWVYGGWGWALFPRNKTNGESLSVQRMGSSFGLKITQPLNKYNLEGFVKGGAVHQHVSVEKSTRNRYTSGQRWGWQIESGLSLPLDYDIALQPGLKYSRLNGTIEENGSKDTFNLNDLSAGIILSITFGGKH